MNISSINFTSSCSSPINNQKPAFKGLVPKKDFKGVILKLTKKDKELISELEKKIGLLELERLKLAAIEDKHANTTRCAKNCVQSYYGEYYADKSMRLDVMVNKLQDEILQIKMTRLNKQKAKLAKQNGKFDIQG